MNPPTISAGPPSPATGRSLQPRPEGGDKIKRCKRILVVDDNIVFLKAMSLKLRAFGYDVLTAVDGGAAVSTVRQAKPDLILLDLNFPPDVAHGGGVGWDGLLILSWLRRMNEAEKIPVIAITAGDLEQYKDQCLAAGVVDLFLKPIDHEALVATIRKTLKEQAPEQEPEPDSLTSRRILFVDDETDWRYMGTLYLAECGYEVFTAEDAAQALVQAAKNKPHVIVLDLNLGSESGVTLLELFAATHPEVPIIIYTGMELDNAGVWELRNQGAFECLRKGTMEELLTAVGRAMNATPQEKQVLPKQADELADGGIESGIESVLIVAEDVAFGDELRSFLESRSFCATRVIDGAEALRQICAVDFDFILFDMTLPSLPGEQFYRAVEGIKPELCKRLIFMTGHQADPRSDGFIRRVRGIMLWKPFPLTDLLAAAQTIRRRAASKPGVKAEAIPIDLQVPERITSGPAKSNLL
jgi:DNA-binding response OmpR family regulator